MSGLKLLNKSAFTLVELLVVIAVIGLLSTIVLAITSGIGDQGRIAKGLQFSQHLENGLGSDLMGRWNFDEGANDTCSDGGDVCDSSGWDNHGIFGGNVYHLASTPSGQGYSLSLDGDGDYVTMSGLNFPSSWSQPFTLAVWIYVPSDAIWSNGSSGAIIGRGIYDGSHGLIRNTTDNQVTMWVRGDGAIIRSASGLISRNKWFYLVGVWTGNRVELYIDGVLQQTSADATMAGIPGTGSWYIGNQLYFSGSRGNYYKGQVDTFSIYSIALTSAQINSQYYTGLDGLLAEGLISKKEYQERLIKI